MGLPVAVSHSRAFRSRLPVKRVLLWGWKTAAKEPVKNEELWRKLLELTSYHKIEFIKVKGHSDNELNNRCDELANEAMDEVENKIKNEI